MKKILYVVPILLAATGCLRENPLLKIEPTELQKWIEYRVADVATPCAPFWADPDKASSSQLKSCEPTQQVIADKMNSTGLSNEEVTAKDILLPAVWKTFVTNQQRREEAVQRSNIYAAKFAACKKLQPVSKRAECSNKVSQEMRKARELNQN